MQFSHTRKHGSISLESGGQCAVLAAPTAPKLGKTVLASTPFQEERTLSVHRWSVRIDNDRDGVVAIGVALGSANVSKAIGRSEGPKAKPSSWAFFSTPPAGKAKGYGARRSRGVWSKYGLPFRTGDVVSCEIDLTGGTLRFFLNFEDLGVAFRGLEGKNLYPAVSLHRNGQRVTFLAEDHPHTQADPDAALRTAAKHVEDAARGICAQAASLRLSIRGRFEAIRAELDRKERTCQRALERRRERLLMQLWRQSEALLSLKKKAAPTPTDDLPPDYPWPELWRSDPLATSLRAGGPLFADADDGEAEGGAEEDGAGAEEGDQDGEGPGKGDGAGEEDYGEDLDGAVGLTGESTTSSPPCHMEPVVSVGIVDLASAVSKATGLQLVSATELTRLTKMSKSAEAAQKAVDRLRASLSKSKALVKQKELQTKRQNPLSPIDLLIGEVAFNQKDAGRGKDQSGPVPPQPQLLPRTPGLERLFGNFCGYKIVLAEHVLANWVEQKSPACAAACAAGAFNSLKPEGCPAEHKEQEDVMQYYREHWEREVLSARKQLIGFFGGLDTAPLEEGLASHGLADGIKPKIDRVMHVLHDISSHASGHGEEGVSQQGRGSAQGAAAPLLESDEGAPPGDEEFDEEDDEDALLYDDRPPPASQVSDFQPSAAHQQLWDALKVKLSASPKKLASLVQVWCTKAGALHKLTKDRPSTGPVGTDRLMAAIKHVGEKEGVAMQVWRLAGGAGSKRHQLQFSDKDMPDTVERQWKSLLGLIGKRDTCIMYHLENHYSLIYGAREWTVDAGYAGLRTVRQLLLARPGQRPCAWVDFDTARTTMMRWAGYCMVGVSAEGFEATAERLAEAAIRPVAEGGEDTHQLVPAAKTTSMAGRIDGNEDAGGCDKS